MIIVHKLNGDEFVLNSGHIETIEERPDTVVTLTNEKKYIVLEPISEIMKQIIDYQHKLQIKINE